MIAYGKTVLIEPITRKQIALDEMNKNKGGIIVEHLSAKEAQPCIGLVRSIGAGVPKVDFYLGDKVVFDEPSPSGFSFGGVDYIPVNYKKVIAKVLI